MSYSGLLILHRALKAAGINVLSVSFINPAISPPTVLVIAPDDQQAAARAIVATFDWAAARRAEQDEAEPDFAGVLNQAANAVQAINDYLAIADAATAAQVRAEVKAIDQRQRAIILALVRAIKKILALKENI